ncbi:unknown [Clostridium sp. CAG:609]|nr:unknown [Clostridium sp. CAG:609]
MNKLYNTQEKITNEIRKFLKIIDTPMYHF